MGKGENGMEFTENRHTAKGAIDGDLFTRGKQSNDENFKKVIELYKNSSHEKKHALSSLFSFDFENVTDLTIEKGPVRYIENKFGFRSTHQYTYDEPDKTIWVFGDSISYGHGLRFEDTWAYKLANNYSLKLYNFSVCGAGIDTATRLLQTWLKNTKNMPSLVVSYGFYPDRLEMNSLNNDETYYFAKYNTTPKYKPTHDLYLEKEEYYISLLETIQCPSFHVDMLSPKDGWHNFYQDFACDVPIEVYEILKNTNHKKYDLTHFSSVTSLPHPGIRSNQLMFEHIKSIIDAEIFKQSP